MTRQEHNLEICQKLTEFFADPNNKDIRFFQALTAMGMFNPQIDNRYNVSGVDDPFHVESSVTNEKINIFLNK